MRPTSTSLFINLNDFDKLANQEEWITDHFRTGNVSRKKDVLLTLEEVKSLSNDKGK